MKKLPEILAIRTIAKTRIFEVQAVDLRFSNGEEPIESANRELQEEIGFAARDIRPLRPLYSGPSHMYGIMHTFVAQDLYPSHLVGDEPEPLEMVYYPLAEMDKLLADPHFAEARNLSALFLLREFLKNENV